MIGHLGSRVSALLDGQLTSEEEERAWAHVHACHQCRDLVEREGWVKTRLAGLSWSLTPASGALKGSLLASPGLLPPGEAYLLHPSRSRSRSMVALGGSALGVTVLGLLALGAAPAAAPVLDRRPPVTSLVRPTEAPRAPSQSDSRRERPRRHHSPSARAELTGVTIPW
ncbi:MAG TPA: hypothetical protein PLP61_01050 [Nocardioides sp.]|uniref:hypothetical protein n=1 Tax=Nocardioides sp. TaxID=35761 RepID=UPI002B858806|nr:hypothetical protein [Nocardioides sp.]HQR25598.1 hypothetical protein [Nocardioides sp.]